MPFDNGTFTKLYDWLGNKTDIPRKRGDSLNQEFENFSDGLTDLKSEIDAKAALSHSHAATDITTGTLADARLPARLGTVGATVADWNDATETGFYSSYLAANEPGANAWIGVVNSRVGTRIEQEVVAPSGGSASAPRYIRASNDGGATWDSWVQVYKTQPVLDARYAQLSGATFTGNLKVLATTAEMRVESTDDNKGIWLDSGSDAYYAARIITDRVEQRLFVNGTTEAYRVSFQQHLWRINAAEAMRLTSNGNLGIGDSNPPDKLTVSGNVSATGTISGKLPSYTVATVPSASASGAGFQIYVTDETGGAVPAFSDGTDWRRVTDRSVIA